MNKTLLVAKETYRREVKTWSFLLMVFAPFIFALVSLGIGFLQASADTNSDIDSYIGIVTDIAPLKKNFKKSNDFAIYGNVKKAEKDLKDDEIDGYVEITNQKGQLQAVYHSDEKIDSKIKSELSTKLTLLQRQLNLTQANLSKTQLKALNVQPKFEQKIRHVQHKDDEDDNTTQQATFMILVFIMYILVLSYTQVTAQDIATEKGTKVMEMIFSSMPGSSYFDGKIIGIIGEIVTQVLIYLLGGTILYFTAPHISGFSDFFNEFKSLFDQILGHIVSWGLIFIVLGTILFVVGAAFCGALASKPEEANKAVQPLTYLAIIGFVVSLTLQNLPDSILTKVLSYVPFFSSFMMPLRIINNNANNIEATISLVILLVFLIVMLWLIRKIYPNLILQTDDNGIITNLKRALKSK